VQFCLFRSILFILRSTCHVSAKVASNGHNHSKCPVIARCDLLWPQLIQYIQLSSIFDKCAWKGYVWLMTPDSGIYFIIWHLWSRITCCRKWWPAIVKNIKFERYSPPQVRIEGPRSSISGYECNALWNKIGRIWSGVVYNGPVFVSVSRSDSLGPYVSLYYLFCAVLALSVRFDHIKIKVPGSAKVGRNGP